MDRGEEKRQVYRQLKLWLKIEVRLLESTGIALGASEVFEAENGPECRDEKDVDDIVLTEQPDGKR